MSADTIWVVDSRGGLSLCLFLFNIQIAGATNLSTSSGRPDVSFSDSDRSSGFDSRFESLLAGLNVVLYVRS